nr:ATP binding cassette sub family A [Hymenolepis microstoma]
MEVSKDTYTTKTNGSESTISTINFTKDTFRHRIPGFFFHYRLLLWKTIILRIREPWFILFELLLPVVLIVVVVGLRFAQMPQPYPPCHLVSQPLPSMGFLPYMRGVICNFNNTCSPHDVEYQSRSNIVPSWLSYFKNQNSNALSDSSPIVTNVAKLDSLNSTPDWKFLSNALCDESILQMLDSVLSDTDNLKLHAYCSLPYLVQSSLFSKMVNKVVEKTDRYIPKEANSIPISSVISSLEDVMRLSEEIKNISVALCGDELGSNSFLNFFVTLHQQWGKNYVTRKLQESQASRSQGTVSACTQLNNLFNHNALQPWTLRFRNVLQGEVFYYPTTSITNEIMIRSNNTAIMLEKLKTIVSEVDNSIETLLPELIKDAPVFKLIRTLTRFCSTLPTITPENRERCKRILYFLEANPNNGYTHYTSVLPMIKNISRGFNEIFTDCVVYDRFHGYSNNSQMYADFDKAEEINRTVTIVNFKETNQVLSMEFRLKPNIIDTTYKFKVMDKYWTTSPRYETRDSMKYFTSGFIDLQDQIERAYISMTSGQKAPDDLYEDEFLPTEMQFVPVPCYKVDPMLRLFMPNIPLLIVVIWLCNYVINVRVIVYEKEIRLKEFTKVMGMSNAVHWLNWFTVGFAMMTTSSIIGTIMLKCGQLFPKTDGFLLFCCFIAYILAILPQAFMISVFFTNANFGAVFGGIFYFIMYLPYNLILIYDLSFAPLLVLTFSPQCTVAMLFSRLMTMEVQGFGGQWYSLWELNLSNESISVGLCMLMLLVDGALGWICVWYLEKVVPTSYGLIRKWYFPFTKSYWREVFFGRLSAPKNSNQLEPNSEDLDVAFHEPPDGDLQVGVSVRGLTKCFGRKKFVAVNNMWVDFYENQITAFLGHNGAGKTTTISILTGIYAPTAGTAHVYGKDINYEMPEIRHHLGLCPQHNVLFDNLTVVEHIKFYGYLKGLSKEEVKKEITRFLAELGLEEKAKELAKNLSGGQKRRLSIAAAFVGDSKMVFLDEPTAGVDPSSRRSIWNLIFNLKSSRTIILTTHHMDEADVLGDRIAIVSQGRVKASGSSLFLKSKFAKFYYLSMEKKDGIVGNAEADARLSKIISSQLPGSELSASTPTEWVFTLPAIKAYDVNGFVKLFTYLEEQKVQMTREFGVKAIGLSDTSLEEIFILLSDDPSKIKTVNPITQKKLDFILKLFKRDRRETRAIKHINNSSSTSSTDASGDIDNSEVNVEIKYTGDEESHTVIPTEAYTAKRNAGVRLYVQQAYAYLAKRKQCVLRSKRGWVLEFVIPTMTVILMMLILASYPTDSSQPSMPLHPWLLSIKKDVAHLWTFFANIPVNNSKARDISYKYSEQMASPRGWSGTRCLPHSLYELIPKKYAYCNIKDYTVPHPLPALSPEEIMEVKQSETVNCCCKNGDYTCPSNAIVDPPKLLLPTTDYLMNLTHYNVSQYLLRSRDQAILKRYGGLMFMETENGQAIVNTKDLLSDKQQMESLFNKLFNNSKAKEIGMNVADFVLQGLPPTQYARIYYHNKGWPSSVAYLNMLHNLQLRMLIANDKGVQDPDNHGIAIANYPINSESGLSNRGFLITQVLELVKAVGVVIAMSFISSSFSTFIIRERKSGFLAMQLLAGQRRVVYWTMSYIWDCTSLLLPIAVIVIVFIIFNETAYISKEHIGGFIVLLLVYNLVITPLMYCFTFAFNVPSVAFVSLLAINILIATITSIIVYMLELISFSDSSVEIAVKVLEKLFLIFPQFAFSRGFYVLAKGHIIRQYGLEEMLGGANIWDWDALTEKIVAMLIETVLFCGIVLLISYTSEAAVCDKCLKKRWKRMEKKMKKATAGDQFEGFSEDVLEEIERVENDPLNEMRDVVRVINLVKYYPKKKKPAVNDLTFGVRSGECFGLLGVNGAGKTTTFNMLTTAIHPTSGSIQIGDYDVSENASLSAHNLIGYCPQFDALLPYLTAYETLQLFARIHGYPEKVIPGLANSIIDRLSLGPYALKPAHTYSGGNLRKLSTAVATIGQPQVLLLDEPTSGMDPGAKRCLWGIIKSLQQDGCSVVLTSHSMEECEALCNRLAIMMDGQFQCFGTVPHLKQRFGGGYIIEVDLCHEESNPLDLFPQNSQINVLDAVGKKCNFEARGEVSLSSIFKHLLALRSSGKITTFGVRQVSLDTVFVNFVRNYEKEKNKEKEDVDDVLKENEAPRKDLEYVEF